MKKIFLYFAVFALIIFLTALIAIKTVSAPPIGIIDSNIQQETTTDQSANITEQLEITKDKKTILMFGGDVMLSRQVNKKSKSYDNWAWPLQSISELTQKADLFVINLESPFTINGNYNVNTGSFSFNADPRSLEALKVSGVDIAGLANNHTINQGVKGIKDTKQLLNESGIEVVGAGLDEAQARQPIIKEINGVKFGFLAYAYPDDYSLATIDSAGLAGMDLEKMKRDVKQLKTQVDLVVVLMHAGYEYTNKPNAQQKTFAHSAIDAGADLIIGHHPHWVQTTEIYQQKPILYSLGNLVFDQMWSQETRQGALAEITLIDKTIETIKIIPIIINDYGQANLADEKNQTQILQRMGLKESIITLK